MKKAIIALLLVSGVLVVGCGKKESAPAAAADDSTGVAECDAYFKKMKECAAKTPAQKAQMETTMTQMREMFKAQGTAPGGKDMLKKQCEEHSALLAKTCP